MKILYITFLILLFGQNIFCQSKANNLLLIKVDKFQELQIDKMKTFYYTIELDSNYSPLYKDEVSPLVYYENFADSHLFSCINHDTIRINRHTLDETFKHEGSQIKNSEILKKNNSKMKKLMQMDISSSLFNQKIIVSYSLIHCNYCVGDISEYDKNFLGYNGKIVMIIDDLKIINDFTLPKENLSDIMKRLNFNDFIY
jgi:hypothetical protein